MGYQKTTGVTFRKINLDFATDKDGKGRGKDGLGRLQESTELYKHAGKEEKGGTKQR